jgi:O-antigen/teichoic acid export membrane protein
MSDKPKDLNKEDDITGEKRFAWNVVTSWFSYLFVLISGFIVPRMITEYQGNIALGIWDFCWVFVNYLRFTNLGIGTSVSRFVAKFRAERDLASMNSTVSSVFFVQLFLATFVMAAMIGLSYYIPIVYEERLEGYHQDTGLVILILGGSLAHYFGLDVFRGIVTGCHRWDVHNKIIALTHGVTLLVMVVVLITGGGLIELSIAYFFVTLFGDSLRAYYSFKVCEGLKIKPSYFSWSRAKSLVSFGVKTIINGLPLLIIIQSTNMFVMAALGPAMLAVLVRPVSLMKHVTTLVSKYSFVLTPVAGSIQATKDLSAIKDFVIESTRYGVAFTLPLLAFLGVYGDRIMFYWMGPDYVDWPLIIVLAIGYFLPISSNAIMRILFGLNEHGKVGLLAIAVALLTYGLGLVVVNNVGWSMYSAAVLIAVSLTLSVGIVLPVYACIRLKISIIEYTHKVFLIPVLCGMVYIGILVTFRRFVIENQDIALMVSGIVGGIVLLGMYWKWIAPPAFRQRVLTVISKKTNSKHFTG